MLEKIEKLNKVVSSYIDDLAQTVDAARAEEAFQRWLNFCAAFHRYSLHNQISILVHRPDATRVGGYKLWQRLGRQVRRGEKGIPILIPFRPAKRSSNDAQEPAEEPAEEPDKASQPLRFMVGHVFDVSQTDGDPLPSPPEWRSPQQRESLRSALIAFAHAQGIQVETCPLPGDTQGLSCGGAIKLAPEAGVKTLIHELAHELMHQRNGQTTSSRQILELQAEGVAYVVARHFGVEGLRCANYIALHGADGKQVRASLRAISACARQIIDAVEGAQEGAASDTSCESL